MKGLGAKRVISILVKLSKLTFKTSALIMESTVYASCYSSACHERTPSGPGKSVRSLQMAADQR